jgi:hypothetical protein
MTVRLGINPIGWTTDCMPWVGGNVLPDTTPGPDLADAARIGLIVDAMLRSADERRWVSPELA